MNISKKIKMVQMPNFVSFEEKSGKKQDSIFSNDKIDIVDFSEQEANEFAEEMRLAFIDHWKKRRKEKKRFII